MCGKEVSQVHDHHIIPWWFSHDDSESNIMRLCASCHRKADSSFDNLILRGKMNVSDDTHKRTGIRYTKKYVKFKQLYYITLCKYTRYHDMLWYNTKTGVVRITQQWYYNKPRSNRYVGSTINIHRRAKKAASSKGQTTLNLN